MFEEQGILADVELGAYPLNMIPFDDDLISLELDGAFAECVLEGDSLSLFYMAQALVQLQNMFGLVPRLQVGGRGGRAQDACNILLHSSR